MSTLLGRALCPPQEVHTKSLGLATFSGLFYLLSPPGAQGVHGKYVKITVTGVLYQRPTNLLVNVCEVIGVGGFVCPDT